VGKKVEKKKGGRRGGVGSVLFIITISLSDSGRGKKRGKKKKCKGKKERKEEGERGETQRRLYTPLFTFKRERKIRKKKGRGGRGGKEGEHSHLF